MPWKGACSACEHSGRLLRVWCVSSPSIVRAIRSRQKPGGLVPKLTRSPLCATRPFTIMKMLTQRQQQVLDFIRNTVSTVGIPPSLREICQHFGFKSVKAASDHVGALRRKGVIAGESHQARSLRLSTLLDKHKKPVRDIPILGCIPAGLPEDIEENAEGCVTADIGSLGIKKDARTFALRVRYNSLQPIHVCKGDLVVCQFGKAPQDDDIVATMVNGKAALRVCGKERGKAVLTLPGTKVKPLPADGLVIQGPMVALVRNRV